MHLDSSGRVLHLDRSQARDVVTAGTRGDGPCRRKPGRLRCIRRLGVKVGRTAVVLARPRLGVPSSCGSEAVASADGETFRQRRRQHGVSSGPRLGPANRSLFRHVIHAWCDGEAPSRAGRLRGVRTRPRMDLAVPVDLRLEVAVGHPPRRGRDLRWQRHVRTRAGARGQRAANTLGHGTDSHVQPSEEGAQFGCAQCLHVASGRYKFRPKGRRIHHAAQHGVPHGVSAGTAGDGSLGFGSRRIVRCLLPFRGSSGGGRRRCGCCGPTRTVGGV